MDNHIARHRPPPFPTEFRPVCRYRMKGGKAENFEIIDQKLWRQRGVVYARVYRKKVVYIGTTDGTLAARLRAHRNGISKFVQGKAALYREWAEGKRITILAYCPPPVKILSRSMRVHRAIEAELIREFRRPGQADWFGSRT